MQAKNQRLGIYTSYNESINGHIQEPVDISNKEGGYLIWLLKNAINTRLFKFPTPIIIKIKKQERFYRGQLIDIKRSSDVNIEDILSENLHRPSSWQKIDREIYRNFKSVLYIQGLREITEPSEAKGKHPPQSPNYIQFNNI
jgi:hypothetical protein